MERLEFLQKIINQILDKHLAFGEPPDNVETFAIRSQVDGNYLLMNIGWQKWSSKDACCEKARRTINKRWTNELKRITKSA